MQTLIARNHCSAILSCKARAACTSSQNQAGLRDWSGDAPAQHGHQTLQKLGLPRAKESLSHFSRCMLRFVELRTGFPKLKKYRTPAARHCIGPEKIAAFVLRNSTKTNSASPAYSQEQRISEAARLRRPNQYDPTRHAIFAGPRSVRQPSEATFASSMTDGHSKCCGSLNRRLEHAHKRLAPSNRTA